MHFSLILPVQVTTNANANNETFQSAVSKSVHEIMWPYAEDAISEFMVFEEEMEWLHKSYETATIDVFQVGSKLYHRCDDAMRRFFLCDDGIVRESTADGRLFRSAAAQKIAPKTVPVKEFWKTFKSYANAHAEYNPQTKQWGRYYNTIAFHNGYQIGGRWKDIFLVKEDCTDVYQVDDSRKDRAPDGYKWVSAARKKDIEIPKMIEWNEKLFREDYRKYEDIWKARQLPEGETELFLGWDGIYDFGDLVYDPDVDIETAVKNSYLNSKHVFSRLFRGYLDPNDKMESHHNDCYASSAEAWADELNAFINSLDDNTVLVTIDYIA